MECLAAFHCPCPLSTGLLTVFRTFTASKQFSRQNVSCFHVSHSNAARANEPLIYYTYTATAVNQTQLKQFERSFIQPINSVVYFHSWRLNLSIPRCGPSRPSLVWMFRKLCTSKSVLVGYSTDSTGTPLDPCQRWINLASDTSFCKSLFCLSTLQDFHPY